MADSHDTPSGSFDHLQAFAAPFFSGTTFGSGLVLLSEEHYAVAVWLIVPAIAYWVRMAQLFYREMRA